MESFKVSAIWYYRFGWKWPEISKMPKIGSYIFATAFVFYFDAKHLVILWGSSHVCYYLYKQ